MTIFDLAMPLRAGRLMTEYSPSRDFPSPDRIADLAYQYYEMRGGGDGHDVDDWLAAERELTRHYRWLRPESRFIPPDSN